MNMSDAQIAIRDYWQQVAISKGIRMPSRADMRVQDIGKHMPYAVIFGIHSDPLDYEYRLVGTAVTENTFGDYTGKKLSEMEGKGPGSKIWEFLDKARLGKEPFFQEVPYVGPNAAFMRSSLMFLPLGGDHENPDMIMLVSHFFTG